MERARDVRAEWDRVLLITGSSKHNLTRMDIEWMRSTYRKANNDVEMGCGKCDYAREGSARDGFEGQKTSSICDNETDECHWRFVGAMFFAFTCVTTIGFGDFSPRTHSGKGFVVVVTSFGMAVAFAIFAEIGERIAVAARRVSKSHASVVLTAALVAYVFAGGAYFHGLGLLDDPENPDVLVGAYFCFVSISTLGLGDVLPRIATFPLLSTYAYTVLGIALASATMHANAKLGAVVCVESHHWFWGTPRILQNSLPPSNLSNSFSTILGPSVLAPRVLDDWREREPPKVCSGTLKFKVS